MEEILQEAEEKKKQKQKQEEEKKKQMQQAQAQAEAPVPEKKSVFAKLKSYNKEVLKTANIVKPNATVHVQEENEDVIVKETANRYTWDGRFQDYKMLQKIDKKLTDKRLGIRFSDFKKMQGTAH